MLAYSSDWKSELTIKQLFLIILLSLDYQHRLYNYLASIAFFRWLQLKYNFKPKQMPQFETIYCLVKNKAPRLKRYLVKKKKEKSLVFSIFNPLTGWVEYIKRDSKY